MAVILSLIPELTTNGSIDVWHQYSSTQAIIASGATYIPQSFQPGPNDTLIPRIDGTWGPHDYSQQPQIWDAQSPYMAWIPLSSHPDQKLNPTSIMEVRMQKKYFIPHSRATGLGGLDKTIKQHFDDDVASIRLALLTAETRAARYISNPPIILPSVTLQRADEVLLYLTLQDIYYRDCLEAVATLRRAFAELQGFILWSHDVGVSGRIQRRYQLRGTLVPDIRTYKTLTRLGVPAWLKLDLTSCRLPPNQLHVALSPPEDLCEVRKWQDLPIILDRTEMPLQPSRNGELQLVHSKALWYYPPYVQDGTQFERVARGIPGYMHLRIDKEIRDRRVDQEIRRLARMDGESANFEHKPQHSNMLGR